MPTPTAASIGALLMQRTWIYEFNLGTSLSPVWAECEGVTDTQFMPSAGVWTDSSDQSGQGKTSEVKTGTTFTGSVTINEGSDPNTPTAHPQVQDFLRTAGEANGLANVVAFRVSEYDFNDPTGVASPRVYAYTGRAGIDYAPAAANVNAKRTAVITLHPDASGPLSRITHPYPATPAAPTITGLNPSTLVAAGSSGKQVIITGTGFTGTVVNGVKFAGVAALSFVIESDSRIVASVPTLTAGSVAVTVQNATGTSSAATLTAT